MDGEAAALAVWWSAVQSPAVGLVLVVYPRAGCWGRYRSTSLFGAKGKGKVRSRLSAGDTQRRGVADNTRRGQRDCAGLEKWAGEDLMKVSKGQCHILPLGWNKPLNQYVQGGCSAGKWFGRKGPGCAGGCQAEHEPAVCPCELHHQQVEGGGPASPCGLGEATAGATGPALGCQYKRQGRRGASPERL